MTKFSVEQMPVTTSGKRMLKSVAPIYEKSFWLKAYFDALGIDFDSLETFFATLRKQTHIDSVDWGIEFMERRYSVEPDPSLTLEARRARLGIRATNHPPLNPAVLEKFARDNFGFEVYLGEQKPGFITIIANELPATVDDFLSWLVEEKPAHLALGGEFLRTIYAGDERYVVPSARPRIVFEPILPVDDADKIHFPRLFAQTLETQVGLREVTPAKPHDVKGTIYTGAAILQFGDKIHSLAEPFIINNNRHQFYAAQVLTKGGQLFVDADLSDLPTHSNIIESPFVELALADIALARDGRIKLQTEIYERWLRANLFALAAHHLNGTKTYSLHRPRNSLSKSQVGQAIYTGGLKEISASTDRKLAEITRSTFGQVLAKTGALHVDSSTKSTVADNERFIVKRLDVACGQAFSRQGNVKIAPTTQFESAHQVTVTVGQNLIRAGNISIGSETQSTVRDDELFYVARMDLIHGELLSKSGFEGVKINSQVERLNSISRSNVGQVLSTNGSIVTGQTPKVTVPKYVLLKVGQGLYRAGDVVIDFADEEFREQFPELGDRLRLYFNFPNGARRSVTLKNPREDLTKTDIRNVGTLAADNQILLNGDYEATTGITRAHLIKKSVRQII